MKVLDMETENQKRTRRKKQRETRRKVAENDIYK
jgi:hypothetical protein